MHKKDELREILKAGQRENFGLIEAGQVAFVIVARLVDEPDRLRRRPIDDRPARAGVENGGDFDAVETDRQARCAHIVEDEGHRRGKSLEHPGFKFRRQA